MHAQCGKDQRTHTRLTQVLNDACRAITGCLQPTNVENLYLLAGIAPPAVRRSVTAQREREKQVNDNRHPLHGHNLPRKRLKSRNSFIHATDELIQSPSTRRLEQWSQHLQSVPNRLPQTPSECLASGASGTWTEWRCLNRLRTKMGRCKHNLRKWKYTDEDDTTCDCKEADQTMEHLLECPLLRQTCSLDDLMVYNDVAKQCVRQWIGLGVATQQEEKTRTTNGNSLYIYTGVCIYMVHYLSTRHCVHPIILLPSVG